MLAEHTGISHRCDRSFIRFRNSMKMKREKLCFFLFSLENLAWQKCVCMWVCICICICMFCYTSVVWSERNRLESIFMDRWVHQLKGRWFGRMDRANISVSLEAAALAANRPNEHRAHFCQINAFIKRCLLHILTWLFWHTNLYFKSFTQPTTASFLNIPQIWSEKKN